MSFEASHNSQNTRPAVDNYLTACSALIEHMRNGGTLTERDLDLLKQITRSMDLLLPTWERKKVLG